ncbi:MAG: DUF1016 family protein [Candidatus Tectomicrobia bacterium]|nr:DUF1016 family protein [Candidatus Tectomicrobia bacterium]
MAGDAKYNTVLGDLRAVLAQIKPGEKTYDEIAAPREQVFARYRPIFSTDHIADLSKDEFTSFLYIENNRHWSGLYRQGLGAATDIKKLRQALGILLDERKPIRERFPEALSMVTGLGKALATAILTVAYPDKYGVWNNTSEAALRQLGLWPNLDRGEGIGGRYEKINGLLTQLSTDLGIDLWMLDAMWWRLWEPEPLPQPVAGPSGGAVQGGESFALERQLEEFLLENWDRTPLAKEWSIYSEPDDPEAGNQYPTDVGRIDILAVHKKEARFLVVELKRNQSTDQTVGQALRYVGWVKKHLAREGQSVEALIIAHKVDKDAHYALAALPNVQMMTYEVAFRLRELAPL